MPREAPARDPEELRALLERFLANCGSAELHEPGESPFRLVSANYALDLTAGRLTIQVWDDRRNFVRRIVDARPVSAGRLDLVIERFGRRAGTALLVDAARPQHREIERRSARWVFREAFRRFLAHAFPGWRVAEISSDPDLEHSLSPAFPRAFVRKGATAWAAIASDREGSEPDHALTFGLIWLEYLRRRDPRITLEGLALFLPEGTGLATCLRLRHLDPQVAKYAVWLYSPDGFVSRLDERDWGNLDTRLATWSAAANQQLGRWDQMAGRLCEVPGVERVDHSGGEWGLRVRGLEFFAVHQGLARFGVDASRPAHPEDTHEIEALAHHLVRMRSADAPDPLNPLRTRNPELWLESQVRAHLAEIDADLRPSPLYGQVPSFAGGERGIADLLSVSRSGRLAVIELKASQDLHLPLQSLDYWMRVQWHHEHADFVRCGYFPGVALSLKPPRLLLVAPALEFHPTTETILQYFSRAIDVERFGLGVEWQRRLKVVFRARGAARPG